MKGRSSKGFQFDNVLNISFAHLFHDIYSSFLAPILPLLIEKLSINYTLSGLLQVVQRIPSLAMPFIGIIADKVCMRYFMIFTPALTATAMSLLGIAPNYTVLVILLFVTGVSSALFHVPAPVMMKKVSGNRIGKGMSFYMAGGEIARTIGPLIIVGAVSLWTLEGTYKLIPLGILASVILFFKLKKINISDEIREKEKEKRIGWKQTFTKFLPLFMTLAAIIFFNAMMKESIKTFLPTYLKFLEGKTLLTGAVYLSIFQFSGIIGTYCAGTISDKIGRKKILLIISIINPVLMWLFVVIDNSLRMPILIIMGIFLFAQGPVLLALVNDVNSDRPAFINSIYMTFSFIIGSISILLFGVLSDWLNFEISFKISAILGLFAIPFILKLKDKNCPT